MNTTPEPATSCAGGNRGQIVFGLVLVTVGAAFTAEHLGYVYIDNPVRFWPLILVAVGLGHVFDRSEASLRSAFWLFSIAAIFLLHNLDVVRLRDSWPLFIVLAGVSTVWKALARPASAETTS